MSEVKDLELIELGEVSVETKGAPLKQFLENGEVGCIQRRNLADPCD